MTQSSNNHKKNKSFTNYGTNPGHAGRTNNQQIHYHTNNESIGNWVGDSQQNQNGVNMSSSFNNNE